MWITVARSNDVKVMWHTYHNRAVLLTNGVKPCYADSPAAVILFEDRPHIFSILQKQVSKWHDGPTVLGHHTNRKAQ